LQQRKKLEAMRKPYISPSLDIENAKTYDKSELLERMKKSTVPKEFLKLWMERGVNWVEGSDETRGHFSRDIRLNGAMLIPNYSSAMLKPEVLLDHYSTPTVRILGKDSEPAQGVNFDDPLISFIYEEGVLDWVKKFDDLENVSVKILPGNHHFFLPYAQETAKIINELWEKNS